MSFTVSPFTRGPNLDIEAKLLDSAGAVVATANPIGALGATVSASVLTSSSPKSGTSK